jgi:putative DNA-invertase from lambdoid prophage Rac
MNVAAYLRVSTNTQTADNQLPAVISYCQSKSWPAPVIYSENESAWRQGHQRELARLLVEIRTGRRRYDYLVVFALDRLTRGKVGDVFNLVNAFEQQGCKIISIKEAWLNDVGPVRDLFTLITAWAANYESERKSQNTRAGLAKARANGKRLGRPPGKKDSKKRLKKRPTVFRYAQSGVGHAME